MYSACAPTSIRQDPILSRNGTGREGGGEGVRAVVVRRGMGEGIWGGRGRDWRGIGAGVRGGREEDRVR